MTNYIVLGSKILVKRDPIAEQDGLYIPDEVRKPPRTGVVIGVGPKTDDVFIGDKIVFHEYAGYFLETTQDLSQSDLIVLRDSDELLLVTWRDPKYLGTQREAK